MSSRFAQQELYRHLTDKGIQILFHFKVEGDLNDREFEDVKVVLLWHHSPIPEYPTESSLLNRCHLIFLSNVQILEQVLAVGDFLVLQIQPPILLVAHLAPSLGQVVLQLLLLGPLLSLM